MKTMETLGRVYFRKTGHACDMNNKGNFSVNVGQFDHENLKFLE